MLCVTPTCRQRTFCTPEEVIFHLSCGVVSSERFEFAIPADLAICLPQADPVQITTLPNQLRVVTGNTPGHFSSVGVYIGAGSRYESSRTSGASHVLDRMAFKVRVCTVSSYIKFHMWPFS
jgi:hypothetical protein